MGASFYPQQTNDSVRCLEGVHVTATRLDNYTAGLMYEKIEIQGMTQGNAAKQVEKNVNRGLKKGQTGYWGESKRQKEWKKYKEGKLNFGNK